MGNKVRPRNGSTLWTSGYPPAVEGRTGYAAHTQGQYIISDSGNIFSQADVSFMWAWGDGTYDEIVEYISPVQVRRRDSDVKTGTGCWLQGRLNLQAWHKMNRKWLIQLGREFFVCDYRQTTWTKVLINDFWSPANAESTFREDGDEAIVANSRNIYKVIFTGDVPIAYPVNSPVLEENFSSNNSEGQKKSRYNYLISIARLDGNGNFRNRLDDPPPKILTESGTCRIDENRRDWSEQYTNEPVGDGTRGYQVLDGAALDTAMANWENVSEGTFNININGTGFVEILVDLRDCRTLTDVAAILQAKLQEYWAGATFEYVGDDGVPRFRVTPGKVNGGSVSYVFNGNGGDNIADWLRLRAIDGATQVSITLGEPLTLRNCQLPRTQNLSETAPFPYQRWPTHYIIYRTADYGVEGFKLDELGERVVNSPDLYVWDKDLRVCGSFMARRTNGQIILRADELGGEFEQADTGSIIEFEDGSRETILSVVDDKAAWYVAPGAYYEDDGEFLAANIGDGRVCRVVQTGDLVEVVVGSSVGSFGIMDTYDVGKRIYWPNGTYSYIRERISDTQWRVYDSIDKLETACAVDPEYRAYCDTIFDVDLLDRASGWTCRNRFMREVKTSNIVARQPAFMVFGARGDKEVWYCQTNPYYKQFVGYHVREYQTVELQDRLVAFWDFTSLVSAMCNASIYTANTSSSQEITIPATQQKIWQIIAFEKRADVGLVDHGAVDAIGRDVIRFVANTHEVIDFNGWDFLGENTADPSGMKRWLRALRRSYPKFAAIYSRVTGYVLWWVRDERIP